MKVSKRSRAGVTGQPEAIGILTAVLLSFTGASDKSSAADTAQPLQGGVQKVELSLEKLRDVGLDLKQVLKAASSLYDEVTLQPVRMITEPEVVGRGIVINIPIGTEPIGPPQPARKERVDLAMSGIKPVLTTMKKNVDDFVAGNKQLDLPDSVTKELEPQIADWVKTVDEAASRETQLEQLTTAPPYDNATIAQVTVAMEKDVKNLDEVRRTIYKVIRKEGKRISQSQ